MKKIAIVQRWPAFLDRAADLKDAAAAVAKDRAAPPAKLPDATGGEPCRT